MAETPPDTHAGGIVFRQTEGGPEYLIVRARRDPSAWVLPKGHIEPGETPEEAAVREVEEEAGCRTTIVAQVGLMEFGDLRTRIYLMRFEHDVGVHEGREMYWGSADEAGRRLTYDDTRRLLARAHAHVLTLAAVRGTT